MSSKRVSRWGKEQTASCQRIGNGSRCRSKKVKKVNKRKNCISFSEELGHLSSSQNGILWNLKEWQCWFPYRCQRQMLLTSSFSVLDVTRVSSTGDALKEHASLPAASHSTSCFQSWPGSPILLCPVTSLFSVAWSPPSLPCRGRAGYHPRDLAFLIITLTNHSDTLVSGDNDSYKVKDTLSFQ